MSKYPSNLSKEEFIEIETYLPVKKTTKPRKWTKHEILNGIFYQLVNGCKWADLPRDLPPYSTVYHWFNKWKDNGTWEKISKKTFVQSRINQGKKRASNTFTIRLSSGGQYRYREE